MPIGDEHFYGLVADELESERDKGTWTKALAQNDFNEDKARATYVELRVEQLKAEAAEPARRKAEEKADTRKQSLWLLSVVALAALFIIVIGNC